MTMSLLPVEMGDSTVQSRGSRPCGVRPFPISFSSISNIVRCDRSQPGVDRVGRPGRWDRTDCGDGADFAGRLRAGTASSRDGEERPGVPPVLRPTAPTSYRTYVPPDLLYSTYSTHSTCSTYVPPVLRPSRPNPSRHSPFQPVAYWKLEERYRPSAWAKRRPILGPCSGYR
jgi:hypothetical protein